jgi:hypothetical protein
MSGARHGACAGGPVSTERQVQMKTAEGGEPADEGAPVSASELAAQAERDLAAAVHAFQAIRNQMGELLAEANAGETVHARKLSTIASDLARAVGTLARERDRIDGARHGNPAEPAACELDLDAARESVRRTLARIRASGA